MADFGYDISDYSAIDPLFGTMADFDALLVEAHARGLKVILDFVPNHTSTEHPWFMESRSSRANPKRDWYIWRDRRPAAARRTTGCRQFGGSAWPFDKHDRPILLPRVPEGAARPQLAQSGSASRPCTTSCASGSSAASMAFAST